MPLPIATEIDTRPVLHRQSRKAARLFAIRGAAVIFAPACLLRVAEQISARDMMVMADLGATHATEK
jgi:hypothetical protein